MLTVHPQYIKDAKGNNSLVVLPSDEFEAIMEELDEIEDVRLYDEAKITDMGERITLTDYLRGREAKKDA